MKFIRILLFTLGACLVLAALLVGIALLPGVQTWAARKVAVQQPGMDIAVGRVSAGFTGAKMDTLVVEQAAGRIRIDSVEARYSAWDYLVHGRLNVQRLAIDGVEINLRDAVSIEASPPAAADEATETAAEGAATPFRGLLHAAELPMDLILAQLSARGRALLPDGREATFEMVGEDISTGRSGTLKWTVVYRDAAADAPVQVVRTEGQAKVRLSADRRLEALTIGTTTTLEGPGLPSDRIRADVVAEQAAADTAPASDSGTASERYSARVSRVSGAQGQEQSETLLSSEAAFEPATRSISGTWNVAVRSAQLGALLEGLGLPDLDLNGAGRFRFAPDTNAAAASGELEARLARLEAVSPELAPIGSVQVRAEFDGEFADDTAGLSRLNVDAIDAEGRTFAQVRSLQRVGFNLTDQQVEVPDPQAPLVRVALSDIPLAWAQPWLEGQRIESGRLSTVLTVAAAANGQEISLRASMPVTLKEVTLWQGEAKLIDRLELEVSPKIDYTAERLAAELEGLNGSMATGDSLTGRLTAMVENPLDAPVVRFGAEIQARTGGAVKTMLPLDPGPIAVEAMLDGTLSETTRLELSRLVLTAHRVDGATPAAPQSLAVIELLQPLQVNLENQAIAAADPTASLARVQVGEVPLAWAEAFVADAQFGGVLKGGVLDVRFKSIDDLAVATTEPVSLRGVSATLGGAPQVSQLDVAAEFSAALRGDTLTYDVRRLGVTGAGGSSMATVVASGSLGLGDATNLMARGKIEADVGALAGQPALAAYLALAQGQLETTFDATMRETVIDAKVNLAMRGLVAKAAPTPLGDLDLVLTAQAGRDGRGTIEVPIVLTADGRRSDVALQASFVLPPAAPVSSGGGDAAAAMNGPIQFDGRVSGSKVFVGDFQAFSTLVPEAAGETTAAKPAAEAAPRRSIRDRLSDAATAALNVAPPAQPKRDVEPFWKSVTGQVAFELQEVHYGTDTIVRNLRGSARISDTGVAVEGVEGMMKDEPLKMAGGITFDAAAAQPYSLTGDVDVKGFALGPLLQPANRREKPQLETTVAVDADLRGQGGTMMELLKNVSGTFDVSGSDGILRMLGKRGETVGKVAGLVGLAGALTGSEKTMAAAELTSAFNELKFDQFRMRVERGTDLSVTFSAIEFISPILRLSGTGSMAPQEGTEVENQPMNIVLQLGAKGTMAQLLNKVGLLSGETDPQGYALVRQTFTVGGTPTNPDASAFWRMVTEAGLRGAAGFLGR